MCTVLLPPGVNPIAINQNRLERDGSSAVGRGRTGLFELYDDARTCKL